MGTSRNRAFTRQGGVCTWATCGSRKRMAVRPSICNVMRCWRRGCRPGDQGLGLRSGETQFQGNPAHSIRRALPQGTIDAELLTDVGVFWVDGFVELGERCYL